VAVISATISGGNPESELLWGVSTYRVSCELSELGWIARRDKYDYEGIGNKAVFISRVLMKRLLC